MSCVFVVDSERRPLAPVHPGRARRLLAEGKAAVLRRSPFTLILKRAVPDDHQAPLRVKLDPGSKTTGIAVVDDTTGQVVWAAELSHRGQQIKDRLDQRSRCRRSRRQRHTRYRAQHFANRRRRAGWLPPSLASRIANVLTWVVRLRRWCPIGAISLELAKFDMALMQNAEISGVQYQQGECAGYEIRQYLLEKFQRRCVYCGKTDIPLEIEHLMPKSRGGSNRVSNLVLSCHDCNQAKGDCTAEEWGHPEVQAQAKARLKDAAAVNATRWALYHRLEALGLPIETGSGGRTKWNRTKRALPKTHWCDAACVGASTPAHLLIRGTGPLLIGAQGRQRRQMCLMDAHGFPRTKAKERSRVQGFRTGDLVRAVVPLGARAGTHVGKVAVRARGSFNITTPRGVIAGISYRHCQLVQRADGYSYQKGARVHLNPLEGMGA